MPNEVLLLLNNFVVSCCASCNYCCFNGHTTAFCAYLVVRSGTGDGYWATVLHSATCSLRSPPLRRESRGQHQWLTRVVSDGGTSGAATPDAAGAVFVAVRAWAAATSTDTGGRGARASGLGAWCKEAGAVSDNSAGGRCACATCAPCCACATCAACAV